MKQDKEVTRVVFLWEYDTAEEAAPMVGRIVYNVVAVFPDLKEKNGMMQCYAHIGQHGSGSAGYFRKLDQVKDVAAYGPLMYELAGVGYRLKVVGKEAIG
jgi:hypothetical protein